jgi:hypothetical protein
LTGPTCSLRVDPCQSNPCQNGGTCTQNVIGGFMCHCPNDFTGLRCERQEESKLSYKHWKFRNSTHPLSTVQASAWNYSEYIEYIDKYQSTLKSQWYMGPFLGCGGQLTGSEGNLRYPHDSGQSYRHNTNCMWWLRTEELGKVLNLTFTQFHLEGSGQCNYDWLQVQYNLQYNACSLFKTRSNYLCIDTTFSGLYTQACSTFIIFDFTRWGASFNCNSALYLKFIYKNYKIC